MCVIKVHCNDVQEPFLVPLQLGFVQISQFIVYFIIVLCHERHRIHHGMAVRRKMVTLGMDLYCFALGKPCAKQHKSILLVTIVVLIGSPWWILYVSHAQSWKTMLIVHVTYNNSCSTVKDRTRDFRHVLNYDNCMTFT